MTHEHEHDTNIMFHAIIVLKSCRNLNTNTTRHEFVFLRHNTNTTRHDIVFCFTNTKTTQLKHDQHDKHEND